MGYNKKIGSLLIILFILIILIVSFIINSIAVYAQDNSDDELSGISNSDKIDKAYSCLSDRVEKKDECKGLPAEDQAFSLLALAYDSSKRSECKSGLLANKDKDNYCWPSGKCRLKDTALSILALDNINHDTKKSENWLLSKNKTSDLIWYLQITQSSREEAETMCTISYLENSYGITIDKNGKVQGSAGSCLTKVEGDYWLMISSSSRCLNEDFTISCNKDFKTNLLYRKEGSGTFYVSNKINSASAGGETLEKVNSLCFKYGNLCNYEGSLWAAYALKKTGHDIDTFIPYLIAFADDNLKYFPHTFLYLIGDQTDESYLSNIQLEQKTEKYWKIQDSPYSSYYDTALGLLSLYDTYIDEFDSAQEYLLGVQENDGCWGSIKDTAFILYAGWPKEAGVGPGPGPDEEDCEDNDYHCIRRFECEEADGEIFSEYECTGNKVCCSKPAIEETCEEKGGEICPSGQVCKGGVVSASNTNECCLVGCEIEESECETDDYICRTKCKEDEEEKKIFSDSCEGDKMCCGEKGEPVKKSRWWIWLLVVLIILLIIAIIFRKKLKLFLFKLKKGKGKGPAAMQRRPPFPPSRPGVPAPRRILPRRPVPRRPLRRPPTRPKTKTDHELEATLKKLKEIGK